MRVCMGTSLQQTSYAQSLYVLYNNTPTAGEEWGNGGGGGGCNQQMSQIAYGHRR